MEQHRHQLENMFKKQQLLFTKEDIEKLTWNTIGVQNQVEGIVYPSSTEEVRKLVEWANLHKRPLYPISRGRNLGYGQMMPPTTGQIIVDLRNMNKIRNIDHDLGIATIEPGVTQMQLKNELAGSRWWSDATGAPTDSSILGNTVAGGFARTKLGDRRTFTRNYEVVLGNGTVIKTGTFPGSGPDLKGLFIQSNLGIVTAIDIELMRAPEAYQSFVISLDHEECLPSVIDIVRHLLQVNILNGVLFIANANRYLVSSGNIPQGYENTVIDNKTAMHILRAGFFKFGLWNLIGGVFGSKKMVEALKDDIRHHIKPYGRVTFFSDRKLSFIERFLNSPLAGLFPQLREAKKMVASYNNFHGLMKGIPTDLPMQKIYWRSSNDSDIGLLWISPVIPLKGEHVGAFIRVTEPLFKKYGFEQPITLNPVTSDRLVIVLSISFNRKNEQEKDRAYKLYDEVHEAIYKLGFSTYRTSILREESYALETDRRQAIELIKDTCDPQHIIAPSRYGVA